MITDEIEAMADELEEAASLDGTENGEWWRVLARMGQAIDYGASDKFKKAWIAEVKSEHKRLKRDFRIVEEPRQFTKIEKRLDFIGE